MVFIRVIQGKLKLKSILIIKEIDMFLKYLSALALSVSVLMCGPSLAAKKPAKHLNKTAVKVSSAKKNTKKSSSKKIAAAAMVSTAGLASSTDGIAAVANANANTAKLNETSSVMYMCEENIKFDLFGNALTDQQLTLKLNKVQHNLERTPTDTGAQRFSTSNKMLDLIILGQTAMVMNNATGQRVAKNCMPSQ